MYKSKNTVKTGSVSSNATRPVSNSSLAGVSAELRASVPDVSPPKHATKKQKRSDEDTDFNGGTEPTTIEGQLALYPDLTEEQAKVAAKREYNRRNAALIRERNKNMVEVLQERVWCLTNRADDLSRSNNDLKSQVDVLQTENRELAASSSVEEQTPPGSVSSYTISSSNSDKNNNNTLSQLLAALQRQAIESQQRQQESSLSQLLSGLAAAQEGASSNVLPQLISYHPGENTQLLNALLQYSVAPLPVRQATQNQGIFRTHCVVGAELLQYRQPSHPLPQDSNLRHLISSMSAYTLFCILSQSSGSNYS
jgi:hypothetical protein